MTADADNVQCLLMATGWLTFCLLVVVVQRVLYIASLTMQGLCCFVARGGFFCVWFFTSDIQQTISNPKIQDTYLKTLSSTASSWFLATTEMIER